MATPAADLRTTLAQDTLVAAGVAVLLAVGSVVAWRDDVWVALPYLPGSVTLRPAVMALLLAESIPLVFRRIAPWPVLVACVAASVGLQAIHEPTPLPLGVLVAVYTVAVRQRPLVSVTVATAYLGVLAVGIATRAAPVNDDTFYDYLISLVATVMLGYGIALGRIRAAMAEQRATEVALDHDARTQAAVAQEQARIAREVHDIVAHDVSVIVAQAASARRVLGADGGPADTLRAIETVGRDALDGLRRLMTLVRSDNGDDVRHPQPTLDRLPVLVEQVRGAGLPVELSVQGVPRRLPGTVETNAYRIVQEALTNALKHAGPSRARVVLDYRPDELHVEVRDDGRGATPSAPPHGGTSSGGFGLVGMRQRAALLDGHVDAGPGEGGGFRVSATLPLRQG